jgi:hypothetical protein
VGIFGVFLFFFLLSFCLSCLRLLFSFAFWSTFQGLFKPLNKFRPFQVIEKGARHTLSHVPDPFFTSPLLGSRYTISGERSLRHRWHEVASPPLSWCSNNNNKHAYAGTSECLTHLSVLVFLCHDES